MLDFSSLKSFTPPKFIPRDFDPVSWNQIEPYYRALSSRKLSKAYDLIKFLQDWNELSDSIGEEIAKKYVLMTSQTDNPKYAKDYQNIVKNILPKLKEFDNALEKKYYHSSPRNKLGERYTLFDQKIETDIRIFRAKNIPLEVEEDLLSQEYQKITGSLTAVFEGKEQTLAQISNILEVADRARREKAWRVISQKRLGVKNKLDGILDKLISLRSEIARNAGFGNYIDFRFAQMHRFDYSPGDCQNFALAVKKHIVPLLSSLDTRRKLDLKLTSLRPWDSAVDARLRPPLKPFTTVQGLLARTQTIISHLDPDFSNYFKKMTKLKLLDLDNRKGKAPGAYQETFPLSRLPFIFLNATGVDHDVKTLLHESGHAFNSLAAQKEWLDAYRHPPLEFAEVASMAMELLASPYFEEYYSKPDADRSRSELIESIVGLLCWIAVVDLFQRWIYAHPTHTKTDRLTRWREIHADYFQDVDWTGLETERDYLWHRQLHIFIHPLYYIEYGIAQLGALQLWNRARKSPHEAFKNYKTALSLGGSKPLPEIYRTAGIKFQFDANIIAPLAHLLANELKLR